MRASKDASDVEVLKPYRESGGNPIVVGGQGRSSGKHHLVKAQLGLEVSSEERLVVGKRHAQRSLPYGRRMSYRPLTACTIPSLLRAHVIVK